MRALLVAFCLAALVAGCQASGKVVATETSSVCPDCKMETKTMAIKGWTHKTDKCPVCKTTWDVMGTNYADQTVVVHVCEHCKLMVEKCPVCAAQGR